MSLKADAVAKETARELEHVKYQLENEQREHRKEMKKIAQKLDTVKREHASMHADALKALQSQHLSETKDLKDTIAHLEDQLKQLLEQLELSSKPKQSAVTSLAQAHLEQVRMSLAARVIEHHVYRAYDNLKIH